MTKRKLQDVRTFLNLGTQMSALKPEVRVTRQVMDLQLLKYAIKEKGLYEPEIEKSIDVCIEGFIWLYANGGTHSELPAIVNEDAEAKAYYEKFSKAWYSVQAFMGRNMDIMEM